MAAAGGGASEEPAPPSLLELPDVMLHAIFSHLTAVSDLAAVAASCSVLRALVRGSSWDQPSALAADVFTTALLATLAGQLSACRRCAPWTCRARQPAAMPTCCRLPS
jgi:hypothetical protein